MVFRVLNQYATIDLQGCQQYRVGARTASLSNVLAIICMTFGLVLLTRGLVCCAADRLRSF